MIMTCIGVNNYHLFLQFMVLTFIYFGLALAFNVYYNFYIEFEYSKEYILSVGLCSLILGVSQLGSIYYAYSMSTWYFGMASRNLHAVEESMAGETYNKAEYWGLVEKQDGCKDAKCSSDHDHKKSIPIPGPQGGRYNDNKNKIFLYTKKSSISNF
jgi:hypothetical protein